MTKLTDKEAGGGFAETGGKTLTVGQIIGTTKIVGLFDPRRGFVQTQRVGAPAPR